MTQDDAGSAPMLGSQPVAWAVVGPDGIVLDSHIYHTESIARRWADETNDCVAPLYMHPSISASQRRLLRKALDAYAMHDDDPECAAIAEALEQIVG